MAIVGTRGRTWCAHAASAGGGDDRVAELLQRGLAGTGERRLVVDRGGLDRDVPRGLAERALDRREHAGSRPQGPPTSTTAGSASATAADSTPPTALPSASRSSARSSAATSIAVEPGRRRPSAANTSVSGIATPSGPTVGTCAISPASPPWPRRTSPSLTTAAPSALAEVHVDEVAGLAAELGAGRPVDVVVDGDRAGHDARQHGGRVERADQERGVGQLDEPPRLAIDRVGGAHDREPDSGHRPTCAVNAVQRARDLRGPGRRGSTSASARAAMSPYTSIASATIPSGAMLVTSAQPVVAGSA